MRFTRRPRAKGENRLDTTPENKGSSVWQGHWEAETVSFEAVDKMVKRERRSSRWGAMLAALEKKFGSTRGLKTIELGCGKGDASLLLALAGADVTLFDYQEEALRLARKQFGYYGLSAKITKGDIFALNGELERGFDVAVSWGVVEHFPRPRAMEACLVHRRAVHGTGMVIISVPNSWCLPYRLNKWWREVRGAWQWGLEVPFSPRELKAIGRRLGMKNVRVHGSSTIRALDEFLFHPVMGRLEKYLGLTTEVRTPLDRFFGHALTLFGEA